MSGLRVSIAIARKLAVFRARRPGFGCHFVFQATAKVAWTLVQADRDAGIAQAALEPREEIRQRIALGTVAQRKKRKHREQHDQAATNSHASVRQSGIRPSLSRKSRWRSGE